MITAGPTLGEVRERFVHLATGRHRYLAWGSEAAPVLVLLHGRTGLVETWRGVAEALSDRWHVLALEQRGHGESQWAQPGQYDLSYFVDDYAAFVEQIVRGPHVLLGHSNGSCAAMVYAARRPDMVRALVLEDGGPLGAKPIVRDAVAAALATIPRSFATWKEARNFVGADSEIKTGDLLDAWTHWSVRPGDGGRWYWRSDVHNLLERNHFGDRLMGDGLWQASDALEADTLFLHATNPYLVEADVPTEMARRNPRIRVVEFPTGHSIHEERLDLFLDTVTPFIDAHRMTAS